MRRVLWRKLDTNQNALCAIGAACRDVAHLRITDVDEIGEGDIVCYSFVSADADLVATEVKQIREAWDDKITLIAGGPHASGDPSGTVAMGFDHVFVGPSEEEFRSYLLDEIDESDRIVIGESFDISRYPISADHLPLPRAIEISRGCPYRCRFCQVPRLCPRTYHRPPEMVIEFVARRGMDVIRFIAPNSLAYMSKGHRVPNLTAIETLLVGLRENGARQIFFGTFPSEIRPDWVTRDAMTLIKRHCDNRTVVIGAQSGADRVLKLIGRDHTVDHVRKAVDATQAASLEPRIDLIFFVPGETMEDREQNFRFIEEMGKRGVITYAHIFMPLPGTPWSNETRADIDEHSLKKLESMVGRGYVKGNWRNHLRILREQGEDNC